jgi:hypothetical protein
MQLLAVERVEQGMAGATVGAVAEGSGQAHGRGHGQGSSVSFCEVSFSIPL